VQGETVNAGDSSKPMKHIERSTKEGGDKYEEDKSDGRRMVAGEAALPSCWYLMMMQGGGDVLGPPQQHSFMGQQGMGEVNNMDNDNGPQGTTRAPSAPKPTKKTPASTLPQSSRGSAPWECRRRSPRRWRIPCLAD